ncbi:hypothetical protein [Couchioplanes caeruleus]|uniref:hypothetical protein n=1 Tax=Couchioplanes caeruleus TaxID=56438 RepID=UPI00373FD35B
MRADVVTSRVEDVMDAGPTGADAAMVSGAFAVTAWARRHRRRRAAAGFGALTAVLLYALVENIVEKPDGIAISGMQPPVPHDPLLPPRPRRHRTRHPRDHPQTRTRAGPPARHPRRLLIRYAARPASIHVGA